MQARIAGRSAVSNVCCAVLREQAIAARVADKGVPAATSDEDVVAVRSLQKIPPLPRPVGRSRHRRGRRHHHPDP